MRLQKWDRRHGRRLIERPRSRVFAPKEGNKFKVPDIALPPVSAYLDETRRSRRTKRGAAQDRTRRGRMWRG
ncbi:MAG: hypothetical protein NVS3B21_11700 [Acidimicrobiales bacterium]